MTRWNPFQNPDPEASNSRANNKRNTCNIMGASKSIGPSKSRGASISMDNRKNLYNSNSMNISSN